jgi:hypothetical protein
MVMNTTSDCKIEERGIKTFYCDLSKRPKPLALSLEITFLPVLVSILFLVAPAMAPPSLATF